MACNPSRLRGTLLAKLPRVVASLIFKKPMHATNHDSFGLYPAAASLVRWATASFCICLSPLFSGCDSAVESASLIDLAAPKSGYRYVYNRRNTDSSETQSTIASVAGPKGGVFVCSPSSSQEYSSDLQSLGIRPAVTRLIRKGDRIVRVSGKMRTTILRRPLKEGAALWKHREIVLSPDGTEYVQRFQCQIAAVGQERLLEQSRSVVTVACAGRSNTIDAKLMTMYAEGLGPVRETQEFRDVQGNIVSTIIQELVRTDQDTEECRKLVALAQD